MQNVDYLIFVIFGSGKVYLVSVGVFESLIYFFDVFLLTLYYFFKFLIGIRYF